MSKRAASEEAVLRTLIKRPRVLYDRLSALSDELLLRIFSNLPVGDINICQRVSHRFQEIAGDSQLWKAAYYDRFVRPRILRLSGRKRPAVEPSSVAHSSRLSRWLDDGHLVKRGQATNWKRQYRVRHNWSRGSCDVNQIPVSMRPPTPPLLARLHDGLIYTVDTAAGLRAWSYKGEQKLLAVRELEPSKGLISPLPTSFALDTEAGNSTQQRLVVGLDNGAFSVYSYAKHDAAFMHLYTHPPSSIGVITALAIAFPYVLSMSEVQVLSLYKLGDAAVKGQSGDVLDPPQLLTSLKSNTVWPPLSLSLRRAGLEIIASIAYCIPTYHLGWSAGVQEVHLAVDGEIKKSRLASAVAQGFVPLASESVTSPSPATSQDLPRMAGQGHSTPTSLSYSHPYLLVSHSDNTLTLYLVNSSAHVLSISAGKRLWGHTSSVFGAHVGERGKAVSISTRGNEVRVWELEGASKGGSRSSFENLSIQVTPEKRSSVPTRIADVSGAVAQHGSRLSQGLGLDTEEWSVTCGWVGFDDENVVVLRAQKHGGQALTVYDFS